METLVLEVSVDTYLHESKLKYWQTFSAILRPPGHGNAEIGFLLGSRYGKNQPDHGVAPMTAAYSLSYQFFDSSWVPDEKVDLSKLAALRPNTVFHFVGLNEFENLAKKARQKLKRGYTRHDHFCTSERITIDAAIKSSRYISHIVSEDVLRKAADRDIVAGRLDNNQTWRDFLKVSMQLVGAQAGPKFIVEGPAEKVAKPVINSTKEYGEMWGDFA